MVNIDGVGLPLEWVVFDGILIVFGKRSIEIFAFGTIVNDVFRVRHSIYCIVISTSD